MSPTARALKWLREHNVQAQVVERRIPRGFTTIDLFGCIDIIAIPPERRTLGIQATSGDNHAARERKAEANDKLVNWLRHGEEFEVWSFRKSAKDNRWKRRVSVGRLRNQRQGVYAVYFTRKEEEADT